MQAFPLLAGSAVAEITPDRSMFLAGYPNVQRDSTGVHDSLLTSALCLQASDTRVLLISNDLIYISKESVARIRQRISESTGGHIPTANILISATHTHSGPKMLDPVATSGDSAAAKTDPKYVAFVEDRIVDAGTRAAQMLYPAEIGLAVADATGIGTNRRDPAGACDLNVPVLLIREIDQCDVLACMLVCSMHPTVLHEDSTLISGDFPAMARRQLQRELFGSDCPVLYHTGPAGNQSPRHVTRANTFAEAERLGRILSDAVKKVIPSIQFRREIAQEVRSASIKLPLRSFMSEPEAKTKLDGATARLAQLRESGAPRTQIRTAEVDFFGAQETLTLARAAASGAIASAAARVMPAEIQLVRIGPWNFIAWPGEMFVEFAQEVKRRSPDTFLISYANGELQGYLVTREAAEEGGYESSNAIFKSPDGGELLVQTTLRLLR
jgi:hypothetical protein